LDAQWRAVGVSGGDRQVMLAAGKWAVKRRARIEPIARQPPMTRMM